MRNRFFRGLLLHFQQPRCHKSALYLARFVPVTDFRNRNENAMQWYPTTKQQSTMTAMPFSSGSMPALLKDCREANQSNYIPSITPIFIKQTTETEAR
mmetsp:Transcript_20531/g.39591  ORF Transcript_20531/g.39591 Transcript_20531/m.39591 type:complete len:98 (+) Transcript_20531:317-610(+)